jgi:hypothetical protein
MSNLLAIQNQILNESAKDNALAIIEKLQDGDINPQSVSIFLKKLEKISKLVFDNPDSRDIIDSSFMNSKIDMYGCNVEYAAIYTQYIYDGCNHPELEAWIKIAAIADSKIKAIQKRLQTIDKKETIVIENLPEISYVESGEVAEVFPPTKIVRNGAKFKV